METIKSLLEMRRFWAFVGLFLGSARADQLHDVVQAVLNLVT